MREEALPQCLLCWIVFDGVHIFFHLMLMSDITDHRLKIWETRVGFRDPEVASSTNLDALQQGHIDLANWIFARHAKETSSMSLNQELFTADNFELVIKRRGPLYRFPVGLTGLADDGTTCCMGYACWRISTEIYIEANSSGRWLRPKAPPTITNPTTWSEPCSRPSASVCLAPYSTDWREQGSTRSTFHFQ